MKVSSADEGMGLAFLLIAGILLICQTYVLGRETTR